MSVRNIRWQLNYLKNSASSLDLRGGSACGLSTGVGTAGNEDYSLMFGKCLPLTSIA